MQPLPVAPSEAPRLVQDPSQLRVATSGQGGYRGGSLRVSKRIHFAEEGEDPGKLNRSIPTGHVPKPRVVADYIMSVTSASRSHDPTASFHPIIRCQVADAESGAGDR